MEKKETREMAIMVLDGEETYVPVYAVKQLMKKVGTCRVYIVKPENGHYAGVVSWKELLDTSEPYVQFRHNTILLRENNFLLAKKMMQENSVEFLPVVDSKGILLGEFNKDDDYSYCAAKVLTFYGIDKTGINETYRLFKRRGYGITLVKPFQKKNISLYERMVSLLRESNVPFDKADERNIMDFLDKQTSLVFPDKQEYHTMQAVCRNSLRRKATYTFYRSFFDEVERMQSDNLDYRLLKDMLSTSAEVEIFVLSNSEHGDSSYLKGYKEQRSSAGFPSDQACQGFFEELYSPEYVQSLKSIMPAAHIRMNGVNRLKDSEHPLFHVRNGERSTCGVPKKYDRTIWFFGPCIMVGSLVDDAHTIESLLQKQLNEMGYSVRVRNEGAWGGMLGRILSTRFVSGDILVIFDANGRYGFPAINLPEIAERYSMPYGWFTDSLIHCNHKANTILAKELLSLMKNSLDKKPKVRKPFQFSKGMYLRYTYLCKYFYDTKLLKYARVGAIVMNCNPFTKGHRYLIEESIKLVDCLIIFVVEEDKSLFSFTERFQMVQKGVKDLKKVIVVPGGAFILSQTTFPEYFIKIKDEDIRMNVEYDVSLFAEFIAKPLGITYRFVGEEKEDPVTAEYNAAMNRILPKYDIRLIEIPRISQDNTLISASRVRHSLEAGNGEKAADMLPNSSREHLFLQEAGKHIAENAVPIPIDVVGSSYLNPLFRILSTCFPRHILEFNFDEVTRLVAQYTEKAGERHKVLDFDQQRVDSKIAKWEMHFTKTSIFGSALLEAKSGDFNGIVYQGFERFTADEQYDLILIKCPFGGGRCIHMDLLTRLPELLEEDFVVLMDHIEDRGGKAVFYGMTDILKGKGREFSIEEFLDEDRKVCAIISKGWNEKFRMKQNHMEPVYSHNN
ncbi:adenylyltransferase/cytidyltransferase family protein [Selenomonas sp. AB3002]|uniref:adenylyltransferase/cytidyltransferase family protein n=1 Tax=Selenomonas sp. AB3002 TaxID=1392502 RepID=UPI000691418E